jgi:hypothetical protein
VLAIQPANHQPVNCSFCLFSKSVILVFKELDKGFFAAKLHPIDVLSTYFSVLVKPTAWHVPFPFFPLFSFAPISDGIRSQHGGVTVSMAECLPPFCFIRECDVRSQKAMICSWAHEVYKLLLLEHKSAVTFRCFTDVLLATYLF